MKLAKATCLKCGFEIYGIYITRETEKVKTCYREKRPRKFSLKFLVEKNKFKVGR